MTEILFLAGGGAVQATRRWGAMGDAPLGEEHEWRFIDLADGAAQGVARRVPEQSPHRPAPANAVQELGKGRVSSDLGLDAPSPQPVAAPNAAAGAP